MSDDLVRVAIIGMTGFAGAHHRAVRELESKGVCKLVSTSTRNIEACRERIERLELAGRGVRLYDDYIQMLDECRDLLEVVIVPSGVPLHAEMHRACVERGLAVYLEKPPTLNYAEFQEMLAVEAAAVKLTNVGFNYIVQEKRHALKRRLLSGEFGAIRKACFSGLWPRPRTYYDRTFWAGRLTYDGNLVLDSPMGNAMSHHAHNMLFWAGTDGLWSWAEPERVEAELYRANDVEAPDTIFLNAVATNGVELRLAFSHACTGEHRHWETVVCEKAVLTCDISTKWQIEREDGTTETGDLGSSELVPENLAVYFDYVRGKADRPMTTLADSGAFVRLYDLALIAGKEIHAVGEPFAQTLPAPDGDSTVRSIEGIGEAFERFIADGSFPSEQGLPWSGKKGAATAKDLGLLPEVVANMVAALG